MSYEGRLRARCSACGVAATLRFDQELAAGRSITAKLEHLDDETHSVVPTVDAVRGHPSILLDPDVEQIVPLEN